MRYAVRIVTSSPEIKFARINCKEYPDTCRKNYVFGYPSLSFFLKKKPGYPYDVPKDAPRIVGTIASFVGWSCRLGLM